MGFFRRFWARRRLRYLTLGVLLFLAFNGAALHFTSQSWFCNSCHIMNTYYDSWQAGTHKEVPCVDCHIAPGNLNFFRAKINGLGQVVDDLLGRVSSKPSASVSDFSCTRAGCHALEEVRQTGKKKGKFLFKHAKHLDLEYLGIVTHCTICHSHVKGENHFEINTNACVTCHMTVRASPSGSAWHTAASSRPDGPMAPAGASRPAPTPTTTPSSLPSVLAVATRPTTAPGEKKPTRDCQKCHEPPKEPVEYNGLKIVHAEYLAYGAGCASCHRNVTAKSTAVRNDQCYACHDFGLERMGDTTELHRVHSHGEHKVECFNCHGVTRHGPSAESMKLAQIDCGACHQGQHDIQQMTYKANEALPHEPKTKIAVTPMFMAHVDCTACHVRPSGLSSRPHSSATVAKASAAACDACHKAGLGAQMIPMWQKNTKQLHQDVTKMLQAMPAYPTGRAAELVQETRLLLELIQLDGSWGVHNPRYTEKLLMRARRNLNQASTQPAPKAKEGQ